MTRFLGAADVDESTTLGYEETLNALLSLIGRQVLILFSGAAGSPFIAGIISGRLDRGELDERLRAVLLRSESSEVETIFFHVGSRQSGFVLRPDEFDHGFWRTDQQLVAHLGDVAISVLVQGELGQALER
ncbi:MAG TPA: hypothetical protein VLV46_02665 [Gaiellaceae bacterium]|nr:hypothetical protein [Gaiellaceae bacterium]